MPPNAVLVARLIHTGLYADGRPNTASVLIPDGDWGLTQQHRKTPLYVPAGGFIDIALTSDTLFSLSGGAVAGFVAAGLLRVELIFRLRDPSDLGGAGAGVSLAAGLNVARAGNVLRFVIAASDAAGFVVEDRLTVSGLTGAFVGLNGSYAISEVTKGADLGGPNPLTWLVGVSSTGGALGPAALAGVTLTLPDGKIRFEARGSGQAGGLGPDAAVYVGGDLNVTGVIDPMAVQITPQASMAAPLGSIFVDATSQLPYFKDLAGILHPLGGGGGGGGGGNVFTYRPGAAPVPSANVYADWASCYAAAAAWPTSSTISIDTSVSSPATIPAGTWDMMGITLGGALAPSGPLPFNYLEAQEGAVLTNLFLITDLLNFSTVSSAPVITIASGYVSMLVDFGTTLSVGAGGAPLIEVLDGASLNLIVLTGANLMGGPPLIRVLPNGSVTLQLYLNCILGSDVLEGSSSSSPYILVASPAVAYDDNNPNWLGSPITVSFQSQAGAINFNQSGGYGLPSTAEDAINELALRSATSVWVYQPGGVPGGVYFADFSTLITVMSAMPGPKELIFDDTFAPIVLDSLATVDMTDVTWRGRAVLGGGSETTVTISGGTQFLRPTGFQDRLRVVVDSSSTHGFNYSVGTTVVVIDKHSSIEASGPVDAVFVSAEVDFYLRGGSGLHSAVGQVIESYTGTVRLYLEDGAEIQTDTLAGSGATWILRALSPSATYSTSQPNLFDTVDFEYVFPLGGITTVSDVQVSDHTAGFFETVRVDTTVPDFNVFLPDATYQPGGFVEAKVTNGGGSTVTLVPFGGQTVDGAPSFALGGVVNFVRLRSDGTNWMVVG